MKVILSPSKTQNRKCTLNKETIEPFFESKSSVLRSLLEKFDRSELSEVLDIQGNLLDKTQKKYSEKKESKTAICCYNGLVFKQLDVNQYTTKAIDYMQKNLYILSAMYGVLTPLTTIEPYRLDMRSKIDSVDLYEYWQEAIDEIFSDEDIIINLASNEFSNMLNPDKYEGKFINIVFKEYDKNKKLRTVAARAKKARGLMLDKMIKNQIRTIEELKTIDVLDYFFDSEKSTDSNLVYIRK